jgi:hypothetical protein
VSLKVFAYNPVGVAGPAGAAVLIVNCPGAEKLPSISLANILK